MNRTARMGLILLPIFAMVGCEVAPKDWSSKEETVLATEAAGALSERFVNVDPATLRQESIDLLVSAAADPNPLMRANAIESLQLAPEHLRPLIPDALRDDNAGVRFVAAMTVGQLELVEQAPYLVPLLDDGSDSVRAAALFGLRKCGKRVDLTPLARLVQSDNPEVRGNVAMVLGELGDPSAAPMIRAAIGQGMDWVDPARVRIVDLQLAEALVKLGRQEEIEVIRAALFTPAEQGEITALACIISGRLRDNRAAANLSGLAQRTGIRQESAEVRLAATYALGLIDPARAPLDVALPYLESELEETRIQAVLTVGVIGDRGTLPRIAPLLADPVPLVRVAAAAAVLRVLS